MGNAQLVADCVKAMRDVVSIPVMKMLEDAFSYANQLGARQNDFVSMPNDEINRYMKMEKLLENKISRRSILSAFLCSIFSLVAGTHNLHKRYRPCRKDVP